MSRGLIVVVDDDRANLKLVRVILEAEGYEVRCAATGEAAIAMLDEVTPQAFLLDIHLPGMGGLEAARRIRARPEHRRSPIIALTASASPREKPAALTVGCDAWITKPFDADLLASTLAALLAAAGTATPPPPTPLDPNNGRP